MALGKRALLAMGTRYQVVGLGSTRTVLKHWRCKNDDTVISSEDEYGSHVSLYPNHQIVQDSS